MRAVRVISGAAFAGLYPPNSRTGIEQTISAGAHGIELDVILTRDGVAMLMHDHIISKGQIGLTSGGFYDGVDIPVSALDAADLKKYDIGRLAGDSKWVALFPDHKGRRPEPIISLATGLRILSETMPHDFEILLELKTFPDDRVRSADPKRLAECVAYDLVQAGVKNRATVIAFEYYALQAMRDVMPDIPLGLILWSGTKSASETTVEDSILWSGEMTSLSMASRFAFIASHGIEFLDVWAEDMTKEVVDAAHAAGLRLGAWGLIDQSAARQLIDAGVDVITSPRPDAVLLETMARRDQKLKHSDHA